MPRLFNALLLFSCVQANAQQLAGNFMMYGPEAKYFSNLNYRVFQSSEGYLWFGTLNGLVRFDGRHYQNYFSDYLNPNSPSDNTIFDIAEDKEGQLWFAGFRHGATRYNQKSGRFTKYPKLTADNNPVYGLYQVFSDRQGALWFATNGRGLVQYDFATNTFSKFLPEPAFPGDGSIRGYNAVTCIVQDPRQDTLLWVGTFHGLFSFDKTTKKFFRHRYLQGDDILIHALAFDANEKLWIGTWGKGLMCFNKTTKQFTNHSGKDAPGVVYDFAKVNDSLIYAACLNQGIYALNTNDFSFDNISPPGLEEMNDANPMSIQKVSVTKDAGVFAGGNYYVYQQHDTYKRLKKNISYAAGPGQTELILRAVCWDSLRQQYWLATTGGTGIYRLKPGSKTAEPIRVDAGNHGQPGRVSQVCVDGKQRVWAMRVKQLLLWNDKFERFENAGKTIPLPQETVSNLQNIAATFSGDIWLRTDSAFFFWQITKNRISRYNISWDAHYPDEKIIRNAEMKSGPDESAWLMCSAGLFHCIPEKQMVKHIYAAGKSENDLAATQVICGAFDHYNALWLSGGNGLQVFKWENYQVRSNHTINDGLPSMSINSIATDRAGKIWIGSAAGLGLFDPSKKIWQVFNRFDGLKRDYLDLEIFIANEHLFIDQGDGFVMKAINEIIPQTAQPRLRITGLSINKTAYSDSLLSAFPGWLHLPYRQNNIDIEFAAMDWLYPFKTSYRYKILGIATDSTWMPNTDCHIGLTGLQPGNYEVHIRALNSSAVWSNELVIPITIRPPFWKTWWFISLAAMLFLLFMYLLYRYRISSILQMQKVRNNISRDLHDEIGATLSSVNMLSAVALKKEQDGADVKPIIEQIKQSVQQAGESIDDIVWSVNPANDSATDTMARIRKYVTELCEAKSVNALFDFEDTGEQKLPMDLRRDLYLVCKEAANNALKYAEAATLKIAVAVFQSEVALTIEDDGKGFDTAMLQHNSRNGIKNMQQRVSKHAGKFRLQSSPGSGTIIVCSMKISRYTKM